MQNAKLKVRRVQPGIYTATSGRGANRRTFEILKVAPGTPDGWRPGWRVVETGIDFLTVEDGWTAHADGLPNKAAAVAVAEAEAGGI